MDADDQWREVERRLDANDVIGAVYLARRLAPHVKYQPRAALAPVMSRCLDRLAPLLILNDHDHLLTTALFDVVLYAPPGIAPRIVAVLGPRPPGSGAIEGAIADVCAVIADATRDHFHVYTDVALDKVYLFGAGPGTAV